ncbi:hypothetical protein A6R68_03416 [Neotoma lepida]|uniref:Uncharacterized protein n=1 Tax=Neotoma lepida TaxID=56216 RepID=A0A1A6GQ96_NEOLE|nr:hypothetical protein A6R68_03416 [Neotoma lepida]
MMSVFLTITSFTFRGGRD